VRKVVSSALTVAAFFGVIAGHGGSRAMAEDGAVGILVLREHGVGSAAQAQPYVDKFVDLAAKQNGWSRAKGQYHTGRASAEAFIQSDKPRYGILSLSAFLGLKSKHNLEIIGQVTVARAGGQQYHLISKSAADLAGCKGKRVASDHADDPKFIEQVVAAGAFKLGDFTLVTTTRPMQTIKKVTGGEAECALVDDAQLAELEHLKGADGVRSVWKSAKLPPMVVVAFPSAPAAERKAVQQAFGKMCEGEGKTTCSEIGIQAIKAASAADYATVVAAYSK